MTKKHLLIISLIALVGFLFFPQISLADDFENITPEKAGEYLELPGEDVEKILDTLHQILVNKGIDLMTSSLATDEQIAVVAILNKASKIHILNHLLVDAPIEITGKIIKTATDMVRLFGAQDVSVALEKFEKETVKMAVDYAMKKLLQDEIKVSPGAINFKYKTYQGQEKEVVFQYIIIYQPIDNKKGKVEIRFYSPNPIEPPEFRGSTSFSFGSLSDFNHDLSPFIAEIQGTVEKGRLDSYSWIEGPTIEITFPTSVPDFGIKPLSLWEKYLLKPIETAIGNIDVVITKATGKSPHLINIWDKIKAAISSFISLSPAAIMEPQPSEEKPEIEELLDGTGQEISELKLTLAEIQGKLDSVLEKMEKTGATNEKEILESEEAEEKKKEEKKKEEEKKEEKEKEKVDEEGIQIALCEKKAGNSPARNKIIINEVTWMGRSASANDEWIELKNISGNKINLTGWQLLDKDQQIKIIFEEGIIPAGGFYLLERTDDESVPNITADLIYSGGLGNTEEALYLFDENCQLQDEVLAVPNWPAGDNSSKRTMERKSNLDWQTSSDPGGTPKRENSSGYYVYQGGGGYSPPPPPPPPPDPEPEPEPEPVCDATHLDLCTNQTDCESAAGHWYNQSCNSEPEPKILISEIQIGDEQTTHDFVRLFNPTQNDIYLGDYDSGYFKLVKRTQSRTEDISIKSWRGEGGEEGENLEAKIPAQGEYLWASSKDDDFPSSVGADTQTKQTIAKNNGVGILFVKNDKSIILDAVGWGDFNNVLFEGAAFPQNPAENQKLARKLDTDGNYIDTDDNSQDFELQTLSSKFLTKISDTINFAVLPKINSPYLVNGTAVIPEGEVLTIEPGVVIKFSSPYGRILVQGTLKAIGTENEKIVFTSNSSDLQPGNWNQIYFCETSIGSQLENVVVKYAGYVGSSGEGAVVVKNTSITIKNSIFENNQSKAVYLIGSSAGTLIDNVQFSNTVPQNNYYGTGLLIQEGSPTIEDSLFENNVYGVQITNNASPEIKNNVFKKNEKPIYVHNSYPLFQGNQMPDNTNNTNGIFIYADDEINQDITWQSKLPYIIQGGLRFGLGRTLTLAPGTIIKFYDSASGLWIKGTLKAIGTENEKIVFTSYYNEPHPGDWGQIYFSEESVDSELDNVIIEYGGSGNCFWDRTTVMVKESSVIFKNSVFQNNKNIGLYLSLSSSVIDTVQFLNHQIAYSTNSAIALLVNGNKMNGDIAVPSILKNSIFRNNTKNVETWSNALITQENNQYF